MLGEPSGNGKTESAMNAAQSSVQMMESLVALAGMTAFSDDCDRLLKRTQPPMDSGMPDSDSGTPSSSL